MSVSISVIIAVRLGSRLATRESIVATAPQSLLPLARIEIGRIFAKTFPVVSNEIRDGGRDQSCQALPSVRDENIGYRKSSERSEIETMFGNAVQAKLASMMLIGAGSFVVGIAPACFVSRAHHLQRRLLLSCTLCFGAGVLLATATLHVLPEVRHGLPDYAELVFSCGFLLLYLVEECVHYFCRGGNDYGSESRSSRLTDSRIAHERGWVRAREFPTIRRFFVHVAIDEKFTMQSGESHSYFKVRFIFHLCVIPVASSL